MLQHIRRREYRRCLKENEVWGLRARLYTLLKWIYVIDLAYILVFALFFMVYFRIDDILSFGFEYDVKEFCGQNRMYFIAMLTVAAVAALVLLLLKKHLAFVICNSTVSVFFAVGFQSQDNIRKYILFNLIPLIVLCAVGVGIYIIHYRDVQRENYEYNKLVSHLYKQATKDKENYTEEQWQEYLDSIEFDYKTDILPDKPLKRSEKSRQRKQAAKNGDEGEYDEK